MAAFSLGRKSLAHSYKQEYQSEIFLVPHTIYNLHNGKMLHATILIYNSLYEKSHTQVHQRFYVD